MTTEATDEILEYLNNMATSLTKKETAELHEIKRELDLYREDIASKMPEQIRGTMNAEFKKCLVCAREWISVYQDTLYNPSVKADILKEEIREFFFSMNEKVVSVQKNFFVLGILEELLNPGEPLSTEQRNSTIAKSRIKQLSREQGLNPSYRGKTAERLWFFGDETNFLQSSEEGLSDDQALDYLLD